MSGLNIKAAEAAYNCTYVGYYELKSGRTGWVFYQENPKIELDHSHYMMIFRDLLTDAIFITNGISVTEATFYAIKNGDEYLVSRYRHDYVTGPDGMMLDGGPSYGPGNYYRINPNHPITHTMKIIDGKEVFTEVEKNE